MLARRLLPAARGGGGFSPPPTLAAFTVTAEPQGGWPWGNAHRYGNYSYIGYANNAGGIRVAIWDHTTHAEVSPVASYLEADGFTPDDQHDSPALWLRSDDRLLAVYMPHSGANAYTRVTVNTLSSDPTISAGWQTRTNIDSQLGGSAYTYPDVHSFAAGPLLFYRDQAPGNWCISQSTDDGATWAAQTVVFGASHAYGRSFRTSSTRLDIVCCDGTLASEHASLYHFYIDSGDPYTTDGTLISGGFPVAFSDMTKIYDGATSGVRAPGDIVVVGSTIEVAWFVQTGTPGPVIADDEDYLVARSTSGGAWSTTTVATNIGGLTTEFTEGGIVIDPANLDHLLVSRREVSDLSHPFRVFDVRSSDGGATWPAGTAVSVNDGNSATYPTFVRDYTDEIVAVWLQGSDYTSQSVFSLGIQGYGTG